jgi:hypothetical protein
MRQLADHPTVRKFQARETASNESARAQSLDREWLHRVCLFFLFRVKPRLEQGKKDSSRRSRAMSSNMWWYGIPGTLLLRSSPKH